MGRQGQWSSRPLHERQPDLALVPEGGRRRALDLHQRRLRPSGTVQFQIQFGEYGGSYVNHCHNTVHEDFALLMRIQLLSGLAGTPQAAITPTPNPTPDGVFFTTPEVLPEATAANATGANGGTAANGGGAGGQDGRQGGGDRGKPIESVLG